MVEFSISIIVLKNKKDSFLIDGKTENLLCWYIFFCWILKGYFADTLSSVGFRKTTLLIHFLLLNFERLICWYTFLCWISKDYFADTLSSVEFRKTKS